MNVVSLLPSATEILYAVGVEPVGVSHECDYPPAAAELPAVNYANVDPEADSADINAQVAEAESSGDGVYGIRMDVLDDLDPDVIVTQGICDVCAVDSVLVEDAVSRIDANPEVVTTDPHRLDDVVGDVERVGAAVDEEAAAAQVAADLRERVDAVRERVATHLDRTGGERPRVAVFDWLDPVMVAGHWMPDVVDAAGGAYGMVDPGENARPREFSEVVAYDPEVAIAAPCGFGLEQTARDRDALTGRDGWTDLAAVKAGRTWALDGHHYANRPGPRIVDTVEHVAAMLHPEAFDAPPRDAARPLDELRAEA
ncbi:ABC transporter substrate-binding protein [Halorubellus sp. JP-L1]|uniref:ABC transporter substrate-binding protein n=1 Tax=Halorubellus sp. JP-L1 TaxID=2715753 RepID=UPI0014092CCE|nr:ABC transporter substrate-binding protein [Halorubellus sp. JP-L1]NHN42000.1 ABC transporter substrate-binding protein [Halorubellus sp. JP-L1]